MYIPKIHVDFQKMDDFGRLLLTGSGTIQDLEKYGIKLECHSTCLGDEQFGITSLTLYDNLSKFIRA